MSLSHIYLDVDGVLANWVQGVLDRFKHEAEARGLTHDKVNTWNIHELLGVTDNDLWDRIQDEFFWANLAVYDWAYDVHALCSEFAPVTFLTSPGDCPAAASGKMKWLQARFPGHQLIMTKDKEHVAGSGRLLVDDSEKNCTKWCLAGGTCVIFPQPWNRHAHVPPLSHLAHTLHFLRH